MAAPEKSKSSSSSDDCSTEDDFIQFDASELRSPNSGNDHIQTSNSAAPLPPPHPPPDEAAARSASDARTQGGEIAGTNPFASEFGGGDKASGGQLQHGGVKQHSPARQVTVRPDVPDPARIPSSIFERSKSTTPVEWSCASNESLFSISGGNSSFSRDQYGFHLDRSGELPPPKFSSNNNGCPPVACPPGTAAVRGPPDTGMMITMDVQGHGLQQHPVTAEAANAEAMKDVIRATAFEKDQTPSVRGIQRSDSASRLSDASNQSFAFPILTQGRSVSVKAEPAHQQLQAPTQQHLKAEDHKDQNDPHQSDQRETPEPAAKAPQGNCFSCCSCSSCF